MSGKRSQATTLVELALETADLELFHTADGEAFVTLPAGTHTETWPLRGGPARRWLSRLFFERESTAPGSQAMQDALAVLEGIAAFRGPEHAVHLRLAEHEGAIYLDLGDEYWQTARIDGDGWEVVADAPVRFRRPRGMRPLPYPVAGGTLDELREFVNIDDEQWPLLVAWTVAALRPRGPFPIAAVHGEQGSAKSTTLRVLRELVDPNVAALRSEPRDGRDLMIAARNGWVCAFDNMSSISPWLSDALCRLSTGGGFATRELFTDSDELLIDVQRPCAVNGIGELATRGDLLDRAVVLYLPRIDRYRPEDEFWAAFQQARPRILGALLDGVSAALANVHEIKLDRPPRMADFAYWAVAAEPALGLADGSFLAAYTTNRADATALTLESSPITEPLQTIAEAGFVGTATELLARLAGLAGEDVTRRKTWPGNANALAGTLRRLAPNLRTIGVTVDFSRDTGRRRSRLITIRTAAEQSVQSVRSVRDPATSDAADAADADSGGRSNGSTSPAHSTENVAEGTR